MHLPLIPEGVRIRESGLYITINTLFLEENFIRSIEHIVQTFKHLSSLQTLGELMTSKNHFISIKLAKLISCC